MADAEAMIDTFYQNVSANLEAATFDDKRMALAILDVRVVVTPERVDVQARI